MDFTGVRGVLLDSSALLLPDNDVVSTQNDDVLLRPGADYVFRKLRYSNIPTGISYGLDLSAPKVRLLEKISKQFSFDIFILNSSSVEVIDKEVARAWGDYGGSILHVASNISKELFAKLNNSWLYVILRSHGGELAGDTGGGTSKESGLVFIDKLEQLPLTICSYNRKAIGKNGLVVGYVMKPSREEDFAKRGAFPLRPNVNGLIFLPLTFELPISTQLQQVDMVIHKATDEIISVELNSSLEISNNIIYSKGMLEVQRCLEERSDCCVIDPISNIDPVLDRFKIQTLLLGLEKLNTEGRNKIRAPRCIKVDNFDVPDLQQRLQEAALSPPSIVKAQVACGVSDAHSMAIVYNIDDYKGLNVPLPAVVQEYVNHSSTLFKFYVLGDEIFHAVKKSTPNADMLIKLSEKSGHKPLVFDSLKSLPTAQKEQQSGDANYQEAKEQQMDLQLVTDAAKWLSKMLNLTIFGFDVVIQDDTGDHVIVDVNYLPSFKEVCDNVAIPAFWKAIKRKYESRKNAD
ncbi:Inositol-1,3,4-trisphosphate 5/6-kinase [Heracleum sosnowskyi]|uniref:inositol-1,3,4-trisphosphate 5/6-kinase n=1 Tax=Heracleum sosnowskyi TaxID=360622 RepID=A0AAD8I6G9_9APIA|nr:Inositol-1,3,4-trisphosphate 5/6-kinase [Heracleum sosnowskyi]